MKTIQNTIEKVENEFIKEFCNDHNGKVRFLRSVFYDEQDGSEQILSFLRTAIKEAIQEAFEETRVEKEEHICRFNDGECYCDCLKAIEEAIKIKQEEYMNEI